MNKGIRKGPLEPTMGPGSAGRPRTALHRCAGWNRCSGNIFDHTISFFTQLSTPWTRSVLLFSVSLNFIRFSQDAFTHKKGVASSLPHAWDWDAIVTAAERASAFSGWGGAKVEGQGDRSTCGSRSALQIPVYPLRSRNPESTGTGSYLQNLCNLPTVERKTIQGHKP